MMRLLNYFVNLQYRVPTQYIIEGIFVSETSTTSATYDQIAAEYAACWADKADAMVTARQRFAARLAPGARVLDVGCGPGRDTAELRMLGLNACGFDRSRGMLAQARQRGRLPLLLGDMRRLPVPDGALDGLWCCAAFLHIPKRDGPAVLHEFRRVLRHDGTLYLSVKQGDGERWHAKEYGLQRFFAYYQPDELDALLASAGFAIAECWADADSLGRPEAWLSRIAVRQ
jgi:ubiquinone/menaquinone biosynthesis C-methylase UbiE